MDEQIKKSWVTTKEYWGNMPPKQKKIVSFSGVGILVFSLVVVIWLNLSSNTLITLYNSLDKQEAMDIYTVLQDMGVQAQMDNTGNILVPKGNADDVRLQLAAKGYPKTALSYDIFNSSNGLTTTEFEKKQLLTQQLQNRLQDTLTRIDGITKAVVTLNLAQDSSFVWEANTTTSTAGVLLTLAPGVQLSPKQVSAIKYLVASSVPKMVSTDVKVVDAGTSIELRGSEETTGGFATELERLGFEEQMERRMEEKVLKQLSLRYGPEEIRVSATVVLDYDKMITESMQYKPENGNTGVLEYDEQHYAKDANGYASGIAGEENNTDIPIVVDQNGDGMPEVVDHDIVRKYAISYIKQQIEKGTAELIQSSMAIMVLDKNLDQQQKDAITEQAAKATNIPIGSISVESVDFGTSDNNVPVMAVPIDLSSPVTWVVIGVALLMLLVIFLIVRSSMKKHNVEKEEEILAEKERLENELAERARILKETAERNDNRENAITNEVKEFAKENPEITASLIRSWLREDE